MSAEVLRRAASLMRERAESAVASPWHHDTEAVMGNVRCAPHPGDDETLMVADTLADSDAQHIASWHPAVALAVADLLDIAATHQVGFTPVARERITAVARAYLGESA